MESDILAGANCNIGKRRSTAEEKKNLVTSSVPVKNVATEATLNNN